MKDIDGYSELQDYMGFYESEFEKRIAININDLNPLMKALYERHLNKTEKVELKLSK